MTPIVGKSAALADHVAGAAEVIERLLNEATDASSWIAPLCVHT
jgi:nitronate monooxygenase